MTALHALRLAASEQPDGDLKRLLTWAELHIGDQYERICELEEALKQADTENQRRANALNAIRAALGELGEVILKENFSWPFDAISKDLSSWRNALAAYGYKPDGTVKKNQTEREKRMTAPRITMPDGKPGEGTVFFVYRAKVDTGSSMHTAGVISEDQHKAIALILQGREAYYEGKPCTS